MNKEFIKGALENGYTGNECKGWDWIRENLSMLDCVFQTEKYKACKGMKHKCMPLLVGNESLSEIEENLLSTAWYLNNDREYKKAEKEYSDKMLQDGWTPLVKSIVQEALDKNKKIRLVAKSTNDWQTFSVDKILKPKSFNGTLGLMPLKAKTRGYSLSQFENAFCKLI